MSEQIMCDNCKKILEKNRTSIGCLNNPTIYHLEIRTLFGVNYDFCSLSCILLWLSKELKEQFKSKKLKNEKN